MEIKLRIFGLTFLNKKLLLQEFEHATIDSDVSILTMHQVFNAPQQIEAVAITYLTVAYVIRP